ncbi:S-adenosyl-L-methionine-dependent methyltransferase [Candidatus Blochmanniella vafra str. BVAF]|uniref:Ribosomal RNA small subunit methyltransferase H n=1 Tax=Blochmanniella vafra (strain BVAF) TaxID=859654 RepID=E8Q5P5_BLOVB|nr:16S rRNA (cytosine(1402)-N(4))-methyltransferase RsmH [Candidatus Blochmannia vafer]ADV33542.1 S-adenosyl-L-methionine-dependent methyltransferase [Candidatus Blochmannia vafer str. BVAF]
MHHKSVLLHEAIEALNIDPSGIYIDGTFGSGGHSRLILSKLTKFGRLIAFDKDHLSVEIGKTIFNQDSRFSIVHMSFSKAMNYVHNVKLLGSINGILLDLGICENQLFDANRGFSFIKDGPLDMRMDITTGQTAAQWIAMSSQEHITWVLKNLGEERFCKKIAKSILFHRRIRPIVRTHELSKIVSDIIVPSRIKKNSWNKHPATRSFLAIRMHINKELEAIAKVLKDMYNLLSNKGRLVIISFNSLEDRLVKHFIYKHSRIFPELPKLALTESQIINIFSSSCQFKNIGKIIPTKQEIKENIRARSAILRCAEKIDKTYINRYDLSKTI